MAEGTAKLANAILSRSEGSWLCTEGGAVEVSVLCVRQYLPEEQVGGGNSDQAFAMRTVACFTADFTDLTFEEEPQVATYGPCSHAHKCSGLLPFRNAAPCHRCHDGRKLGAYIECTNTTCVLWCLSHHDMPASSTECAGQHILTHMNGNPTGLG